MLKKTKTDSVTETTGNQCKHMLTKWSFFICHSWRYTCFVGVLQLKPSLSFFLFFFLQGRGERAYDIYSRLLRERIICVMGPVSIFLDVGAHLRVILFNEHVLKWLFIPALLLYTDRWLCIQSGYCPAALPPVRKQQQTHPHVHQQPW